MLDSVFSGIPPDPKPRGDVGTSRRRYRYPSYQRSASVSWDLWKMQMTPWMNAYCWHQHVHFQVPNVSDPWKWQSLPLVCVQMFTVCAEIVYSTILLPYVYRESLVPTQTSYWDELNPLLSSGVQNKIAVRPTLSQIFSIYVCNFIIPWCLT